MFKTRAGCTSSCAKANHSSDFRVPYLLTCLKARYIGIEIWIVKLNYLDGWDGTHFNSLMAAYYHNYL